MRTLSQQTHIIIASVHRRAFSETFIRQHVAHLPYRVGYAWGGYLGHTLNHEALLSPIVSSVPWLGSKLLEDKWVAIIKQRNIKLVLAEYGPVGVHWLPICQKAGIPLMVYFHGFDATRGGILKQYELKYKELFAFASKIFVVSKPMKKCLFEWGVPDHKLVLNPCGVDGQLFPYAKRENVGPVVLSVGRFAATKRPDLVIRAFSKILRQVPNATLRMAGAGEMLPSCKALVSELKLSNSVHFIGVLTPEQVVQEMHDAQVFVQHSMTTPDGETEGAPVAIMEAGATGLPVVSTLHAGIPEIVQHGTTGFLVAEGDVEGMANCIALLLENEELRNDMGQAAAKWIAQYFSLERNIRILTETIDKQL